MWLKDRYIIVGWLILTTLLACKSATTASHHDHNLHQDPAAKELVAAAIRKAGGLHHWNRIKQLSFQKDYILLDSLGEVEKSFVQTHQYNYLKDEIHITSIENIDTIVVHGRSGNYIKTINGHKDDNITQASLERIVNAATYVVAVPFNLDDERVGLRYDGRQTLNDGRTVEVVTVYYTARTDSAMSSGDIWRYHIDPDSKIIVSAWVQTSDHYSYIDNLTFEREGGLQFNGDRKSYRVNEAGEQLYLRATYRYYNYQVIY